MKIFNCLAMVAFVLVGTPFLLAAQGVQWETDFKTAMKTAQETNRLVLIHFYGNQCPPCRMMDRDIFPQQAVADALAPHFVPLKVNTEENPKAVQNLNITSIPMDLIVTPKREIIFRRGGACSAQEYVNEMLSVIQALNEQRPAEEDTSLFQVEATRPQTQNSLDLQVPQAETSRPYSQQAPSETPVISQTALLETQENGTPELFVPEIAATTSAPQTEDDFAIPNTPLTADTTAAVTEPAQDEMMLFTDNAAPAAATDGMTGLSIPNVLSAEEQENLEHESPYILDGFCPVELQDKERWTIGKSEFSLRYRDRFFLFSSMEAMKTFSKNPSLYTPVAMGEDVVQMIQGGQRIKGKRHYGAWYQGRIYLFATQDNYNAFAERPSYFADFAVKLESALGQMQASK